ncbi:MAG: LamG-like jellyroll fold domain-containing protein [Acidobacteriota bacterium]
MKRWLVNVATGEYVSYADPNWWNDLIVVPRYGVGSLYLRYSGDGVTDGCPGNQVVYFTTSLTRITFVAPDGTEYDLRDQLRGGQPATVTPPCPGTSPGASRGKVFVTADGTAATFISDATIYDANDSSSSSPFVSGYLMTRDGTRYRIELGNIMWMRDRNGNKVTFTYDNSSTTITDSLNRQVTIEYAVTDVAPYGLCDRITLKGFGGADRKIRISKKNLGEVLRYGYTLQTGAMLFPELNGSDVTNYDTEKVSAVWLPDGRRYKFFYNSYGELARVELPTGGAFEYDWTGGLSNGTDSGVLGAYTLAIYRRVVERRVYPDGGTGASYANRMTYSRPESALSYYPWFQNLGYVTVDQYDATGSLLTRAKHYFHGDVSQSLLAPDWYPGLDEGREYQTEAFATNGTTVLRRIQYSWQNNGTMGGRPINPRIVETDTTIEPSGANLISKETFAHDQYNNQTDVYEYDYGSGTPGSLKRYTHTEYLTTNSVNGLAYDTINPSTSNPDPAATIHLRSLPSQISVYNASAVERARTKFEYDNYSSDTNHAGLIHRSTISGLDSAYTTSLSTRGNTTATTNYLLNISGSVTGSVASYAQYDIAGNLVKTIDARGYAATIDFRDNFGGPPDTVESNGQPTNGAPSELGSLASYAFPFAITNALGHTSYAKYDYYLGRPVAGEDPNGIVSRGYFNDALDRLTQVIRAANQGAGVKSQSTFGYDDTNHVITSTSDQTSYGDNLLKSQMIYDGLGRTTEKRQYETSSAYTTVRQTYDALGRAYQTSNPFRSGETVVWTATAYDSLGRVMTVTTPDNAVVSTYYNGNQVLVKDQAGKERMSQTNALGQLSDVWEITAGDDATESISFPNRSEVTAGYRTKYEYDTLGNLATVTQRKGTTGPIQSRTFAYDSLKRLTSAANPESGTISYQYDNNGNLLNKTDARSVVSTYVYDALNRATSRSYSDGTPTVTYMYDSSAITNGKGRLASVSSSVSSYSYSGYDATGKVLSASQTIYGQPNQTYPMIYTYDLSGQVTSIKYPSLRTVTNTYDAAGRTSSVTGNLGGPSNTYATGINYNVFGGISKEQYGTTTALYHKTFYNIRGQMFDKRVSSVNDTWDWNRGRLIWYYSSNHAWGGSGTDNNGNVIFAENWVPPPNATLDQAQTLIQDSYTYDALNRLSAVNESSLDIAGGGPWVSQFAQVYNYDRYGNRTINQTSTWGANIPKPNFGVDTATNRLTAPAGSAMNYDNAGNLTTDTYTGEGNRTYDAENRMKQAWANNQWQTYSYDGDGRRVKRLVNGVETWQVYGVGGELLAEYAVNTAASTPQKEYGYRNGELLITADAASGGSGGSGNSLSLDGSSGYVQVPNSASINIAGSITLEAWIKPSTAWANQDIVTRESWGQGGTGGGYELSLYQGKVRLDFYQTPSTYTSALGSTAATANTWHHVAGVFDGSQMRVYLDGVLDGSYSTTSGPASGTSSLKIGRTSLGSYFNGLIDEVRLSNAAVYTSNFTPQPHLTSSSSTKGLWKFDGQNPNDSSGNGNNGTLNGGATYSTDVPSGGGGSGGGGSQNVNWTNAVGVVVNGNSLTKTAATGWGNAGAVSTQTIASGDGYVEFTATDTGTNRFCGLSNGDTNQHYTDVDFGLHPSGGVIYIYEGGVSRGTFGSFAAGDVMRVAVEGGVIKYRKNGTLLYTSTVAPTYPLLVDSSLYANGDTLSNVVISGASGGSSSAQIHWLVTDQLGTPRMVFDQTGSLANISRHDYLPFGEELYAGTGGRTPAQGYTLSDNVRQKFTLKERDNETGLDYFVNRYFSATQGRFTSPDLLFADQWEEDPQSWNLYTYVGNSPLNSTDPFGLWKKVNCDNGGQCWESDRADDTYESLAKLVGSSFVNGKKLAEFFQGQAIELGKVFDTSGAGPWAKEQWIERFSAASERYMFIPAGGGLVDVNKAKAGIGLLARIGRWLGFGKKAASVEEGLAILRQSYEAEVKGLADKAAYLKTTGHSVEEIAIQLHAERRALGVKYKDITPPEILQKILERNLRKYGDELGPSIDWLRRQGKSWKDIIESASRPGGGDLKP